MSPEEQVQALRDELEEDQKILYKPVFRKPTGVFIPYEIWDAKDLSAKQKMLWGELAITHDTQINGSKCPATHLAKFVGLGRIRTKDLIKDMINKGYVAMGKNYRIKRAIWPAEFNAARYNQ